MTTTALDYTNPDETLVLDLRNFRREDLDALYRALSGVYNEADDAGHYECSDHLHEALQGLDTHPRFTGDAVRRR
mgnify:CR=1 FL=1